MKPLIRVAVATFVFVTVPGSSARADEVQGLQVPACPRFVHLSTKKAYSTHPAQDSKQYLPVHEPAKARIHINDLIVRAQKWDEEIAAQYPAKISAKHQKLLADSGFGTIYGAKQNAEPGARPVINPDSIHQFVAFGVYGGASSTILKSTVKGAARKLIPIIGRRAVSIAFAAVDLWLQFAMDLFSSGGTLSLASQVAERLNQDPIRISYLSTEAFNELCVVAGDDRNYQHYLSILQKNYQPAVWRAITDLADALQQRECKDLFDQCVAENSHLKMQSPMVPPRVCLNRIRSTVVDCKSMRVQ